MKILIKNGYVVDSTQNLYGDAAYDILIENNKIVNIQKDILVENVDEYIDATGLHVLPGLVDIHVHLRDPGFTYKEDILSGSTAAAHGGVTSILCMPNTNPVIDSKQTIDYINDMATNALCNIYICGSISQGMQGKTLADYFMYSSNNVKAISDDGKPVYSAKLMKEAIIDGNLNNLLVISHCEDEELIDKGIMNLGETSKALGVKGMDISSEDILTAREILLAKNLNKKIHIAHVSSNTSVELIKWAKSIGVLASCETCPHYFIFTEDKLNSLDANFRMNPPLRTNLDKQGIINGIKDGVFDCIVTDHAPHSVDEKSDFYKAPNGVIGMEHSFCASYTHLVKTNIIPLYKLVELMSLNPSKLINIDAGTLNISSKADIAIFNLNKQVTVDKNRMHSKSKNAVFHGETFYGKLCCTIVNGNIVVNNL